MYHAWRAPLVAGLLAAAAALTGADLAAAQGNFPFAPYGATPYGPSWPDDRYTNFGPVSNGTGTGGTAYGMGAVALNDDATIARLATRLGVSQDAVRSAMRQVAGTVGSPSTGNQASAGVRVDDFPARLATALGESADRVREALDLNSAPVNVDDLSAQLAQRLGVTPDRLREAMERHTGPIGITMGPGGPSAMVLGGDEATLAQSLGISLDRLRQVSPSPQGVSGAMMAGQYAPSGQSRSLAQGTPFGQSAAFGQSGPFGPIGQVGPYGYPSTSNPLGGNGWGQGGYGWSPTPFGFGGGAPGPWTR